MIRKRIPIQAQEECEAVYRLGGLKPMKEYLDRCWGELDADQKQWLMIAVFWNSKGYVYAGADDA